MAADLLTLAPSQSVDRPRADGDAGIDPLTGVLDRPAFEAALRIEQERALRHGRDFSVVLLGLDRFTDYNAVAGRQAGDECLRRIAGCLTRTCRATDLVGRLESDQFVVLAPETGAAGAGRLADRFLKTIWNLALPHHSNSIAKRVTASAGVATGPAPHWEAVARRASEALHAAKALGRNTYWSQPAPAVRQTPPSDPTRIHVLSIDDDSGDAALLKRGLDQIPQFSFAFHHARNAAEGRTELAKQNIDLVFIDYRLGGDDGQDVIRRIRGGGFLGPVIAVTGQGDEYAVAGLMRSGADDYVAKTDISAALLSRAIQNARNQQARREAEAQNQHLLAELKAAKQSLEGKNSRLTELYNTAHQFVDNVSHEFRTPLTVIREFSSILRDGLAGPLLPEQLEYLDIVLNRTDDLSTMVDDMLDVSKLEAGLLGISRRNCTLAEIVTQVRSTLERRALAAKVKLEFEIAADLPEVYCDPEKISRVIINLTINGLKFCQEGGLVRVKIESVTPDAFARILIIDNGPGIDPAQFEAIFERFKQLDCTVRSSTKGFGLGLSIAKELVNLNFGTISVASTPGVGSTFSFTIPAAKPAHVLSLFLKQAPESPLALVRVHAPPAADADTLHELNEFLQHQIRRGDLLFQRTPSDWVIVAAAGRVELGQMLSRIEGARVDVNQNRPGGSLPKIALEVSGVWQGLDQQVEMLRRFESEFDVASPGSGGVA